MLFKRKVLESIAKDVISWHLGNWLAKPTEIYTGKFRGGWLRDEKQSMRRNTSLSGWLDETCGISLQFVLGPTYSLCQHTPWEIHMWYFPVCYDSGDMIGDDVDLAHRGCR